MYDVPARAARISIGLGAYDRLTARQTSVAASAASGALAGVQPAGHL